MNNKDLFHISPKGYDCIEVDNYTEALKNEYRKLLEYCRNLDASSKAMKEELERLRLSGAGGVSVEPSEELEAIQAERDLYADEADSLAEENEILRKEAARLREENKSSAEELKALREERDRLAAETESFRELNSSLTEQIDAFKSTNERLAGENKSFAGEIEKFREAIAAKQAEAEEAAAKLAEALAEAARLKEAAAEKAEQNAEEEVEKSAADEEPEAVGQEADETVETPEENNVSAAEPDAGNQSEIERLQNECACMAAENAALGEQLMTLADKTAELEEGLRHLKELSETRTAGSSARYGIYYETILKSLSTMTLLSEEIVRENRELRERLAAVRRRAGLSGTGLYD